MVDEDMARDLLSFRIPVVAIIDPFQLPPVNNDEESYFARRKPHARLTEVHRQARDNPILAYAHEIRKGKWSLRASYSVGDILRMWRAGPRTNAVLDRGRLVLGAVFALSGGQHTRTPPSTGRRTGPPPPCGRLCPPRQANRTNPSGPPGGMDITVLTEQGGRSCASCWELSWCLRPRRAQARRRNPAATSRERLACASRRSTCAGSRRRVP